jgi:hypothetical protein
MDDGACGDAVNRHVTICCFRRDGTRGSGDPAFRALFDEHEKAFMAILHAERDRIHEHYAKERAERWARGEQHPNEAAGPQLIEGEIKSVAPMSGSLTSEIYAKPRKLAINWNNEAVIDLGEVQEGE